MQREFGHQLGGGSHAGGVEPDGWYLIRELSLAGGRFKLSLRERFQRTFRAFCRRSECSLELLWGRSRLGTNSFVRGKLSFVSFGRPKKALLEIKADEFCMLA